MKLIKFIAIYLFAQYSCLTATHIIYVIRHGATDWNVLGKVQGITDIPLNEQGEQEAIKLREKLAHINFVKAYSSNLSRAYKTAQIILYPKPIEIVQESNLRERARGSWEGQLISDIVKLDCHNNASKQEWITHKTHKEQESFSDTYQRFMNHISKIITKPVEGPILISSHAGVIAAILYHTLEFKLGFRWHVGNCGYIKIQVDRDGQITILETDNIKHVSIK
ncbi:MAG: histidine phosphatase family protein [Candidatus Babeliales bacterium]|nr:histidine phosphatase family protein [Candidatus Babeliales bacterium]